MTLPDSRLAVGLLALAAALGGSGHLRAQVSPNGSQFQVNTYTPSDQQRPDVAMDARGRFVVIWESRGSEGTDGSEFSVQAQLFDAHGAPLDSETQLNTYTPDHQWNASVASNDAGNFVAVWYSSGSAGTDPSYSIQGLRFRAGGLPSDPEFQVNSYTTGFQRNPDVDVAPDGSFVAAWDSEGSTGTDSSGTSIQARRHDASGAALGPDFQINTYTPFDQYSPAIASDALGNFVVAWTSAGSSGSDTSYQSIQARLFDSLGTPLGPDFQVNTYTLNAQYAPDVARDDQGNFVVVWQSAGSTGSDASGHSIQARRFDADGIPLGSDVQVNSLTSGDQTRPRVAAEAQGGFVVAWRGFDATQTTYSIRAQRYLSDGTPIGAEFQVDSSPQSGVHSPAVTTDAHGNFLVAWQSWGSDGTDTSEYSVQARRFDALFRDGFESGNTSRWSSFLPRRNSDHE